MFGTDTPNLQIWHTDYLVGTSGGEIPATLLAPLHALITNFGIQ